ncbi:MAG: RNA 2',3'-cyclic phosphodiesterase [Candidatus Omnitrophica bacterium]|nr:RNA 2',3'-cyclic phosphodiesterase [Candidatus Omnitrophota bacterium]MDD5352821.1 RNA 2',3'-cyclic phosphodiesterase [Candidatus Omnitrophota bacterium]MDD5550420.1 RNA 2',3'-cyclic phosphodiesterase [Candidatus Omnitrophota bacterium]
MPGESIRTFIALEIEDKIKDKISEIQETIKRANLIKASWVAKNNLHLTLKFLGDTKLKDVEKIKEKIKNSSQGEQSIKCNLNKIGVFPNERSPRVIWAGIEGGYEQIAGLVNKLETNISELGFKKEKRDFKTHITICRPRQILNPQQFGLLLEEINKNFEPQEFVINELVFFESKLTPQGSIYTPLASYHLE